MKAEPKATPAPKGSGSDLLKKHPKEVALAAAAAGVLLYAAHKKSSGSTAAAVIDPNAAPASGGIASSGGGPGDPGSSSAIASALEGISSQIAGLNATPVPNSPGGATATATDSLTTPISQLTAAVGALTTAITPPPTTNVVIPPKVDILPYIGPVVPQPVPQPTIVTPPVTSKTTERDWIRVPTAASSPTPIVQGLLGKTVLPRSARGD